MHTTSNNPMSNNSSTGGYLLPAPPAPLPGNLTFKQFLQSVFQGVSGLPGNLIFPRWQVNPPKQPDIYVTWLALGVTSVMPDAFAYSAVNPPTVASGFIQLICNPLTGDVITINGVTITFVQVLTSGNQVLIAASSNLTATNLAIFLNASVSSSLTVATYSADLNVVTVNYSTSGSGGNAYTLATTSRIILLSGPTLTGGAVNGNIMQRHEEVEVQCAFYGPDCEEYSAIVRDGLQLSQNLEALRSVNMGFVGTSAAMQVPDLTNERWVDRFEMTVTFRREILRSYPILSLASVSGSITASLSDSIQTVDWDTNV